MTITPESVERFLHDRIRPKIRVDGGEIAFVKLDGDTVHVRASHQCAGCPATHDGCKWWIEQQLTAEFGRTLTLSITVQRPYYLF